MAAVGGAATACPFGVWSVRQRRAREPAEQAADDARETRGRRGTAEGEAATCPGKSRPRRTYVTGRSTGTGFTGTRARILPTASMTTRHGKRGGMTLWSYYQGAMTRRVGRSAAGSLGCSAPICRGCGTSGGTRSGSSSSIR